MRTEDGHIVRKCIEGDAVAFGLLVDKYRSSVYALAYSRLRNFHDAEDITQEVFVRAYQKLRSLKNYDRFLAWLYSITSNLCKDFKKKQSRTPDSEYLDDHTSRINELSIETYEEDKIVERIHEALDSLSETYREILILYYLGDMDSADISKFLGISPSAVRQRLSRARQELRESISFVDMAFEQRKLSSTFTFHIVEKIKRINIEPIPRTKGLPWYISITTGAIITILSLNQHFTFYGSHGQGSYLMLSSQKKSGEPKEIPIKMIEFHTKSDISIKTEKPKDISNGSKGHATISSSSAKKHANKWIRHPDMPTGRLSFGTCALGKTIYAIGGLKEGWGTLSKVETYDVFSRKWSIKKDMPTPRYGLCVSIVEGKIYAIGGITTMGPKVLSTVEEYDPLLNRWQMKADMPTPRSGSSACAVNGKIYVLGGVGTDFITALPIVEEYDPKTNTWTRKSDMPTARSLFCAEVVNGKIYVIGGQSSLWDQHRGMLISIVEEYDPATDRWTRKADMPTARCMFSSAVINGKIYVLGGASMVHEDILSIVEVYDPSLDRWSIAPNMSEKRFGLSSSALDGSIYVIGGLREMVENFFGLSTVEEFIPE